MNDLRTRFNTDDWVNCFVYKYELWSNPPGTGPIGTSDPNFQIRDGDTPSRTNLEFKTPNTVFYKSFMFRFYTKSGKFVEVELQVGTCGQETLNLATPKISYSLLASPGAEEVIPKQEWAGNFTVIYNWDCPIEDSYYALYE